MTSTREKALFGTAAVTLILGASRWGSNIGANPVFLTDALIGLAVLGFLVHGSQRPTAADTDWSTTYSPPPALLLFFTYVVTRVIASYGYTPRAEWLRDAAPFMYAFLAFFSAAAVVRSSPEARARTVRVLRWALVFHLVWMLSVLATGRDKAGLVSVPFGGAPLFQIRPDIDAALAAVLAGLCLRQFLLGQHRALSALGVLGPVAAVLSLQTRAGLLSLIVALAVAFVLSYAASAHNIDRRTSMVIMIPVALIGVWLTLPLSGPGQRLLATIDPTSSTSAAAAQAQGTQNARMETWSTIIEWTDEGPSRSLIGSGFGNNFLDQSGTLSFLQGTTYEGVRSPHNWFVGNFARLGLVGVALSIAICAQLLVLISRHRRRIGEDALLTLSALIVVCILPVATLGVVLEAPFGAVPFWWAAGIIFAVRHPMSLGRASSSRRAATSSRTLSAR